MLTKYWQIVDMDLTYTFLGCLWFSSIVWSNVEAFLREYIFVVARVRILCGIVGRMQILFLSRATWRSPPDTRSVANGHESSSRFSWRILFLLCLSLRQRKFEMPKRIKSFELSFLLLWLFGRYLWFFVFWILIFLMDIETLSGLYSFHLELFLAVWKFWDSKFHQFEIYDLISISKFWTSWRWDDPGVGIHSVIMNQYIRISSTAQNENISKRRNVLNWTLPRKHSLRWRTLLYSSIIDFLCTFWIYTSLKITCSFQLCSNDL